MHFRSLWEYIKCLLLLIVLIIYYTLNYLTSQILLALLFLGIDFILIKLVLLDVLVNCVYPYFSLHKAEIVSSSACLLESKRWVLNIFHFNITINCSWYGLSIKRTKYFIKMLLTFFYDTWSDWFEEIWLLLRLISLRHSCLLYFKYRFEATPLKGLALFCHQLLALSYLTANEALNLHVELPKLLISI